MCFPVFIFQIILTLSAGRFGLVCLGGLFLFLTTKYITPKKLRYILIACLLLIGGEYVFTTWNEASLKYATGNRQVTIMTYNLFFKNKSRDLILNQIKETNPDILLLQELTPAWENVLSKSIGQNYPYKIYYTDKGTHGLGVYSKYKLTKDILLLNEANKPFAQIMTVSVYDKNIQLVNTHLASPAAAVEHPENFFILFHSSYVQRTIQLNEIIALTTSNEKVINACILAGDLNTTPYEPIYRDMRSNWVDVFDKVGTGSAATFPNTNRSAPFLTLDYIFVNGTVKPLSANVCGSGSSDHLAVVAKIKI